MFTLNLALKDSLNNEVTCSKKGCRIYIYRETIMKFLVVVLLVIMRVFWASGKRCTIFGGCNDEEYSYRRNCTPKVRRLGRCLWAFQQRQCVGDLSCKCNSKLCNPPRIIAELGRGLGRLGIPDLGSAISSCCRCLE